MTILEEKQYLREQLMYNRCKKVVELVYERKLSMRQAAKEFNISRQTVWRDIFIKYPSFMWQECTPEQMEEVYEKLYSIRKNGQKLTSKYFK